MAKNYIRVNKENEIRKAFSDAFYNPEPTDICINENGDRLFSIADLIIVKLPENIIMYNYKYIDKKIVKKTPQELLEHLNNPDLKKAKIQSIRIQLLNMSTWINSVWTAQEYGHNNNINKKDRLITPALYRQWVIWFEDMSYLLSDLDLNTIDYNDIALTNTNIFKPMPDFPGDILQAMMGGVA